MPTVAQTRALADLADFQRVRESQWAMTPALQKKTKDLVRKLPPGLDPALVGAFYAKVDELTLPPKFSAEMPVEYFPAYARWRIDATHDAMRRTISEGLVSQTAYLFACDSTLAMVGLAAHPLDADVAARFVRRQRLIETHERYTCIPNFKRERFEPLARDEVVLDAARRTLANDWFLERWRVRPEGAPPLDYRLWAACKLVLRLAGEKVTDVGSG